ncbi:hypothetical protein ACFX2F_007882 [Malus domestica]
MGSIPDPGELTELTPPSFDEFQRQTSLMTSCTLLWKELSDHFLSLEQNLLKKSEAIKLKIQTLEQETKASLDELEQREVTIRDSFEIALGKVEKSKEAALKVLKRGRSDDEYEERIGGRINTSEFGGDRIEMGATWIHGIGGSPVHKIAQEINPRGKQVFDESPERECNGDFEYSKLGDDASRICASNDGVGKLSVGSFLRQGLDTYWVWKKKTEMSRTYTSAGDLLTLDYNAESEYRMFPGEEIIIAKGYFSIVQSLASVLPPGLIQLGKKVRKIQWQPDNRKNKGYESDTRLVKLHFSDGSVLLADHVIVTVSLGVLKASICQDSGMFNPPLPRFKTEAISRLGFGVVNKLFLQLGSIHAPPAFDAIPRNPEASSPRSKNGHSQQSQTGLRLTAIVEIVTSDIAGIGILALVFLYIYRLKKKKSTKA